MQALDSQLFTPAHHHRILFSGEYQHREAQPLELRNTHSITAIAYGSLCPVLKNNDLVVRKNTIKIKHNRGDGSWQHGDTFLLLALAEQHFGDSKIYRLINLQATFSWHNVKRCLAEESVLHLSK